MINIIDHAWQFELKNFSILPTVLKFANSSPKQYFYSSKQRKILRKKEQTQAAALEFLCASSMESQNYFLITQKGFKQLQFSLVLQSQIEELLKDEANNLAIVCLPQNQNRTSIVNCSFDVTAKLDAISLMVYDKQRQLWSSQHQVEIPSAILQSYMLSLWKELPQILKVQSKCQRIQVILSATPSFGSINLLWCNELLFSKKEFYEISYSFLIKEPSLTHVKKQKSEIIIQTNTMKSKVELPKEAETFEKQAENEALAICFGCGCEVKELMCRQVPNDDVISLRRKNNLSIRGILQQSLPICEACYYSLDE